MGRCFTFDLIRRFLIRLHRLAVILLDTMPVSMHDAQEGSCPHETGHRRSSAVQPCEASITSFGYFAFLASSSARSFFLLSLDREFELALLAASPTFSDPLPLRWSSLPTAAFLDASSAAAAAAAAAACACAAATADASACCCSCCCCSFCC